MPSAIKSPSIIADAEHLEMWLFNSLLSIQIPKGGPSPISAHSMIYPPLSEPLSVYDYPEVPETGSSYSLNELLASDDAEPTSEDNDDDLFGYIPEPLPTLEQCRFVKTLVYYGLEETTTLGRYGVTVRVTLYRDSRHGDLMDKEILSQQTERGDEPVIHDDSIEVPFKSEDAFGWEIYSALSPDHYVKIQLSAWWRGKSGEKYARPIAETICRHIYIDHSDTRYHQFHPPAENTPC